MFQWLLYKKRLQAVRRELADLELEMGTLPTGENAAIAAVAAGVGKIANILIRVLDSLPG